MLVYVLKQRWHHLKYPSIYHITSCSPDTLISSDVTLKHWDWEKWPLFYRRNFQMEFGESKCLNFEKIWVKFVLQVHSALVRMIQQATNHYLKQWWSGLLAHTYLQWFNKILSGCLSGSTYCNAVVKKGVKLLRPSDAYMHRWTMATLVQIMPCRLNGVKSLSEPMLAYCQLEQTSVKL